MNSTLTIFAITLLTTLGSGAQPTPKESEVDPIQAAIEEFESNRRKSKPPTEVSVVLPPPDEKPAPPTAEPKPEPAPKETPAAPVLVIGKSPQDNKVTKVTKVTEVTEVTEEPTPPTTLPDNSPPKPPRKGLEVRVEKIQVGKESLDPSLVKLLAPFPAKPLSQAPTGWHIETSKNAPPFIRDVELAPGKHITLTVRPHVLVPNTDAADAFDIPEPGFDPSLGYCQNSTVGAVLAQSIRQLDDDSKELGTVINHLQQLLISLPKPEPTPAPKPTNKPATKPTPKR
jgi:hypothetical protein